MKTEKFLQQDFAKSGISENTLKKYLDGGYLQETTDGWKLYYPELYENTSSSYYNKRLIDPKCGQKYIKPQGQPSRLFRPLGLDLKNALLNDEPIIITEGEKKAIKANQEGFNCLALSGVWSWKQKPADDDEPHDIQDIIPDIINLEIENKTIILCYDADMWGNEQVKNALYSFAAYLIFERKANVKIAVLPQGEEKGLDDFLIKYGKEEFQKMLKTAREITLKEIQNILSGDNNKKLRFPIEIFKQDLGDLIIDIAKRMDAPVEYLASSVLIGASMLMDGFYSLKVRNNSDWIEHPIIWGAIIGKSSQKKTPSLNVIRKIIGVFEEQMHNEHKIKEKEYKKKLSAYKKQKEQAKKTKDKTSAINFSEEPEKPYEEVITIQDTTKEALATTVKNNNGRGVGILVDELASFLKSLGQYKNGNGSDEEYFLQAWKKQQFRQTRKTNEENFLIYPSHNILGTIQHKVLEETLFKDGFDTTNGMIERWLFICTDYEETGQLHNADKPYNIEIINEIYLELFNNKEQKIYQFSKNSQIEFDKFCQKIVNDKKKPLMTELKKNYIQKQTDYVARFSLVLHCIKSSKSLIIQDETVRNAIKLSDYFIECFDKVARASMDLKSNVLSMYALEYIRTKTLKTLSPSRLHRSNTSRYRTIEAAKIALQGLASMGYGRTGKTKNSGMNFIFYS